MNQNGRTRLDRIEEKIDKMAEAIISLARAEEKIHSLEEKTVTIWQSIDDLHEKFDDMEERLREAEVLLESSKQTISRIFSPLFSRCSNAPNIERPQSPAPIIAILLIVISPVYKYAF